MRILGIDLSSTTFGWAVLSSGPPLYGHDTLDGDIACRCSQAMTVITNLLSLHAPTLVVIESPVARFPKAVLPQARTSGAVLAVLSRNRALWTEVTPTAAKQVLTGDGTADKRQMVEEAAKRLGLTGSAARKRGKVVWVDSCGAVLLSEDEADAYALALCGLAVKVEVKSAA